MKEHALTLTRRMPICTSCTRAVPYLYTVYPSADNLKLEKCVSLCDMRTSEALRLQAGSNHARRLQTLISNMMTLP